MDRSCYLDKVINKWLKHIELKYIKGYSEPEFPDEVEIEVTDIYGSRLHITMYLDGISNPKVFFYHHNQSFWYNGDVSIYESILNIIETNMRFSEKG